MIYVLVKASSPVVRAGLQAMLREDARLTVISSSPSANGRMPARVDVMVVEVATAGNVRNVSPFGQHEGTPVVLLADHLGRAELRRAFYAGVRAVLPRDTSGPEIIAAVEAAAAGLTVLSNDELDVLLPSSVDAAAVDALAGEPLTAREMEILALLAEGVANKEIAARLNITEHTVKFHVSSILSKLGVTSRGEAVARGLREGLIVI